MNRAWTVVLLVALLASGCSYTPLLIVDLPVVLGPTPDFNNRVQQHFPVGSDETKLLAELQSQRFKVQLEQVPISEYAAYATYERRGFPCAEHWTIKWKSELGRIAKIVGYSSGLLCL